MLYSNKKKGSTLPDVGPILVRRLRRRVNIGQTSAKMCVEHFVVNPQSTDVTTVDIQYFYRHLYNQLLKVKYAVNLETLIYVAT